jgi:hypothetical protein
MVKKKEKNATLAFHNRIAVVFDLDKTRAPETFAALLEHGGIDADTFKEVRIQSLIDEGWDKKLSHFYSLAEESDQRDDITITADTTDAVTAPCCRERRQAHRLAPLEPPRMRLCSSIPKSIPNSRIHVYTRSCATGLN